MLLLAYPASSGPASFALAKGWIDAGDYRFFYSPLDSVLQGTPLSHSYVWYHMSWWQVGHEGSTDRESHRRGRSERYANYRAADAFGLPSIAAVSVPIDPPESRMTILHLADWHFVPFDVFAVDERAHDSNVSEERLQERYEEFLTEVEAVQVQQRTVLDHLIEHHDLQVVYLERVTDELLDPYMNRAKAVAGVDPKLLAESVERAEDDGDSFSYAVARLAQDEHLHDRLDTGAAGMLWAEGKLREVRAAEDAEVHAAANPVQVDGTVRWNETAQAEREQAIAQRLLAATDPLVVVVLGGRHDLSKELAGAENVRLVRVDVQAWRSAVR